MIRADHFAGSLKHATAEIFIRCRVASRRAAERLIAAGRVKVNGTTVKNGLRYKSGNGYSRGGQPSCQAADEKEYIL